MEKSLNQFLSDSVVMYHKLQNFHWYAKGRGFFTIHVKLEDMFNGFLGVIDDVAETMLMHGFAPAATMSEYLSLAQIKEAEAGAKAPKDIYEWVLADFEYLYSSVMALKKVADDGGYYQISSMLDDIIAQLAKNNWMLRAELDD